MNKPCKHCDSWQLCPPSIVTASGSFCVTLCAQQALNKAVQMQAARQEAVQYVMQTRREGGWCASNHGRGAMRWQIQNRALCTAQLLGRHEVRIQRSRHQAGNKRDTVRGGTSSWAGSPTPQSLRARPGSRRVALSAALHGCSPPLSRRPRLRWGRPAAGTTCQPPQQSGPPLRHPSRQVDPPRPAAACPRPPAGPAHE